jgi:glucose/arabinose dehydrogenase
VSEHGDTADDRGPEGARGRVALLGGAGVALIALVVGAVWFMGREDDDEPQVRTGDPVEGRAPTSGGSGSTSTSDSATTSDSTVDDPGRLAEVNVKLTEVTRLVTPTKIVARPGSELLYGAEQVGRVVTIEPDGDSLRRADIALDLTAVTASGGERGLLGLAFSPDGETLYVHHSGLEGETRVASFAMEGAAADPASRNDLLEVEQPFANHNGGEIVVDEEGLLWIGLGDGGSGGDPDDRSQDTGDLLGKILRIDPTGPTGELPYGIPADNPFADGVDGRPEIALTGVRNPWRFRFDPESGDLWIADVGQNQLEEIDHLPAGEILGANLGWSHFEGSELFDDSHEVRHGPAIGPVFEMDHEDGWCSVTGGVVYRGDAIPDLQGAYLFGDYCKPGLAAIRVDGDSVSDTAVIETGADTVVSIDTDLDGEVYVVSLDGVVSRLDPA